MAASSDNEPGAKPQPPQPQAPGSQVPGPRPPGTAAPKAPAPRPSAPGAAAPTQPGAAAPKPAAPGAAAPRPTPPGAVAPKAPRAAAPEISSSAAPKPPAAPQAPGLVAAKAPGAAAPKAPGAVAPKTPRAAAPKPAPAAPGGRSAQPHVAEKAEKTRVDTKTPGPRSNRKAIVVGATIAGLAVALGAVVLLARWCAQTEWMAGFIERYPGMAPTPDAAPKGFPGWLNWAHFFNIFLMALVIRTGITMHSQRRPAAYWAPRWNPQRKLDLTLWLHLGVDVLWIINGVAYVVLLFWSGHWARIVPTSWEVIPNAVSAGVQYLTLDWPVEHAWVHYNALQQIFYFATVFVAAPLAVATGVRMSEWWPRRWNRLSRIFPLKAASALHFPVMIYFVIFVCIHTALVFTTGVIAHLNAMFAAQDSATSWLGPALFALAMLVTASAVVAVRPLLLAPVARLVGKVTAR